jgi:secondary thiamine-phosphate synthase enzyme
MAVKTYDMHLSTKGFGDMIDVTQQVQDLVKKARLSEGIATVFIPGSTAAVTTVEYESGAVQDLKDVFDRLVPTDVEYAHNLRWGDGNGFSHVRSALLKTSLTIPFTGGHLMLGRWQQVTIVDFDNGARDRRVVVQVMGE